ncbi:flagellar motor switch protein FliN [alpha proteobacterium IMCC14465]|uniref:Flagellar motor switch protein FliN n=1 Tax=alpha proteobacterium IMCC14465 TaxID=1220535 RepID=J9E0V2_9PROT|nr:flagellar motor switch protein FliN [alpha proteobacterium IMCC14465]
MSETDQETIEEKDTDATETVDAAADAGAAMNEAAPAPRSEKVSIENLRVLENIEVNLTVVVGGTELKIRDLLRLNEGSVIELDRLAGDPLDILANGIVIAKGEVVMIGERFGIRFTEIVDPEKRVENL